MYHQIYCCLHSKNSKFQTKKRQKCGEKTTQNVSVESFPSPRKSMLGGSLPIRILVNARFSIWRWGHSERKLETLSPECKAIDSIVPVPFDYKNPTNPNLLEFNQPPFQCEQWKINIVKNPDIRDKYLQLPREKFDHYRQ